MELVVGILCGCLSSYFGYIVGKKEASKQQQEPDDDLPSWRADLLKQEVIRDAVKAEREKSITEKIQTAVDGVKENNSTVGRFF